MARPCIRRRVKGNPRSFYFKPAGIRMVELDETILALPEFEAVRLVDFLQTPQENAARQMQISQPTFSRILKNARKKISDAIIHGKAIKIER